MSMAFSNMASNLQSLWSWWSDEMRAMLPAGLKGLPTERDRFDILLEADSVTIETVAGGEARRMVENCALEELDEESWEQIAALAEEQPPRLFLESKRVLQIPVILPRASAGQLRSALTLQISAISPLKLEYIVWDFAETARTEKEIHLVVAIARLATIDNIESHFFDHALMPPTFCARAEDHILTLRKPLEIRHSFLGSKDQKFMAAAALMLATIPVTTIAVAELLTSLNIARAERLEQDLAPRLAKEKQSRQEEMVRRAAAPLYHIPSASNRLESLARHLPGSDWTVASTQSADGRFEFIADMADRDAAEAALQAAPVIRNFRPAEEIPTENLRARVRYEVRP